VVALAGNSNETTVAVPMRFPMPGKAVKGGSLAGVMVIVILEI
jgi:hypothetical protein